MLYNSLTRLHVSANIPHICECRLPYSALNYASMEVSIVYSDWLQSHGCHMLWSFTVLAPCRACTLPLSCTLSPVFQL